MRSFACVRASTSVWSGVTEPWRTRKRLIRPANGSAIVLKTNAAVCAPSMCVIEPVLAGDGTPSTIRSSSARVPRFFVATPQATGKTSPRVTASLSACATSSTPSSSPSRYFSISASSVWTTSSSSFSRYSWTSSAISSGIGPGSAPLAALGARVRAHVQDVDDPGQLVLGCRSAGGRRRSARRAAPAAGRARGRSRRARGRACSRRRRARARAPRRASRPGPCRPRRPSRR